MGVAGRKTKPLPFQWEGVRFLGDRGRGLIGDEPGLGKTLQAAVWLAEHPQARPALIVCPAYLKGHWKRELWAHAGVRAQVVGGRQPHEPARDVVVINYEVMWRWKRRLNAWGPRVVVMDECHMCGNLQTKRTRACVRVTRKAPHVVGLSGTPIRARPVEFFPVLHMIAPKRFPSWWRYVFAFCDPKPGFRGRGWNFDGHSNLDELHAQLDGIMIRRRKEDVLDQLPGKRRVVLPVEIDNWREYARARDEFLEWYAEQKGKRLGKRAQAASGFLRMGALLRLVARGKLAQATDWVGDFLHQTDRKLVVFAKHRSTVASLAERFPGAVVLTGAVPPGRREAEVERFQRDTRCRLCLGTIKAAGVGNTLTAASDMLVLEYEWTPADMDQAEDRIHRIGQNRGVVVYYMVGEGTVDEHVLDVQAEKRTVVKQVVDGGVAVDERAIMEAVANRMAKER